MEKIMVGWSQKDITPDKRVNLFGHFAERLTDKVRDPITATALFIGTRTDYAVMVSCDLCIIYQEVIDRCRKEIKKELPDIDEKKVIFNATHTHDAPGVASRFYPPVPEGAMSPEEYGDFFVKKATEAVKEAWQTRKRSSVSWAWGQAVVGHNRRAVYFEKPGAGKKSAGTIIHGTSAMYGRTDVPEFSHIEGYEDHGVDMLFTWNGKKKLTGVIVNIACTSQETEGLREISADFWHEARNEIRKRLGENIYILPQCAAAGDQSPHLLLNKQARDRMLSLKGVTMREEIGRRIADAVEEALPYAEKDRRDSLPFKHAVKKVPLKRRVIKEAEIQLIKKEYQDLQKREAKNHKEEYVRQIYLGRCRNAMERYRLQKTSPAYPTEVHTLQIGDVALATNQFELYLDYGLRIKARSPFIQTFIVQLSGSGTYLPTEKGMKGAGYSASAYDNIVGPEGGRQLVEGTLSMLNRLAAGGTKHGQPRK